MARFFDFYFVGIHSELNTKYNENLIGVFEMLNACLGPLIWILE